jgi:hypothetical protein
MATMTESLPWFAVSFAYTADGFLREPQFTGFRECHRLARWIFTLAATSPSAPPALFLSAADAADGGTRRRGGAFSVATSVTISRQAGSIWIQPIANVRRSGAYGRGPPLEERRDRRVQGAWLGCWLFTGVTQQAFLEPFDIVALAWWSLDLVASVAALCCEAPDSPERQAV